MFAKVFAITEGLLPRDEKIDKVLRYFPLEAGIITGAIFFCLGAALLANALLLWKHASYGELSPLVKSKFVIPSIIFILLSFQITFSSFFLSILKLHRK